jgi:hypothetical protein
MQTLLRDGDRIPGLRAPLGQQLEHPHERQNASAVLHHLAAARSLHGAARQLLQARDAVKRQREAAVVGRLQDQQPLPRHARHVGDIALRQARALAQLGDDAGALRDAQHVEDERDPAVAHDGGPGEHRDPLEQRR